MKTTKWKEHTISLFLGLLGAFTLMKVNPLGSVVPTRFGFYWALFTGLIVSFSVAWTVKKFQKKPKE